MNIQKPIASNSLNNWNGSSRKGQAIYDQQFEFEKFHSEIMDIIDNWMDYSEDEVDAAYAALAKIK